ncbi:hypothetical protein [Ureibacillus aquaedulcis]|uniref:Transposase n=1 Tax=Ureibacillus aquaedulcis TaxID=3058421 RepID=A0ABT8GU10_9BACL|nr:hypothetical protein [Ureibacillus sp. BA0131]MDN4494908.1 hypothetical protein [Ureibacillus sp. BA0131]
MTNQEFALIAAEKARRIKTLYAKIILMLELAKKLQRLKGILYGKKTNLV